MSFPRYPAYKDSGVEWLGEVPEHWEMVPLGTISTSLQTGPFGSQLHSSEYVDNETPVINPSNIQNGRLVIDPSSTVGPEVLLRLERHRLLPGDIVVGRRGEMGRCAVVTDESSGWLCGTGSLRVRLQPSATSEFVGVHLRTDFVREWLSLQSVGSTMENLNTSILARVPVPYPPVLEQQAVVEFLDRETDKIDALVAEQEKMIELLKEKRQAVISHAVTKGLDPSVPMKDSGVEWLGEVPAHWAVASLGYLSKIDTGSTPDRSIPAYWDRDVPWVKTGEVDWTPIHGTEEYISLEGLKNSACKVAPPGTLLMAMYGQGMTRGRAALLAINSAYNQACAGIQFGARVASDFALFYFMAAYAFIRDSGNETSQMNLSVGIISKFRLPVPPRAEQDAIVQYLRLALKKHVRLEDEARSAIVFLQERRSALISAAVTGQIDVRGLADRTGTPDLIAAHADSTPTQGRFDSESTVHAA